jgi:hypothetical protein
MRKQGSSREIFQHRIFPKLSSLPIQGIFEIMNHIKNKVAITAALTGILALGLGTQSEEVLAGESTGVFR